VFGKGWFLKRESFSFDLLFGLISIFVSVAQETKIGSALREVYFLELFSCGFRLFPLEV
jgi:hypothetical protein